MFIIPVYIPVYCVNPSIQPTLFSVTPVRTEKIMNSQTMLALTALMATAANGKVVQITLEPRPNADVEVGGCGSVCST